MKEELNNLNDLHKASSSDAKYKAFIDPCNQSDIVISVPLNDNEFNNNDEGTSNNYQYGIAQKYNKQNIAVSVGDDIIDDVCSDCQRQFCSSKGIVCNACCDIVCDECMIPVCDSDCRDTMVHIKCYGDPVNDVIWCQIKGCGTPICLFCADEECKICKKCGEDVDICYDCCLSQESFKCDHCGEVNEIKTKGKQG